MLGEQTLFGDDGSRGHRGEGVRGDCHDITTNRLQCSTFQPWIPELWMRLDSGFQSPGFQIPKAKKHWIPDSGFPYVGRKIIKLCSASRTTFRAWFYRTDPQNIGGQFGTLSGFLRNTLRKRTSQKKPRNIFQTEKFQDYF